MAIDMALEHKGRTQTVMLVLPTLALVDQMKAAYCRQHRVCEAFDAFNDHDLLISTYDKAVSSEFIEELMKHRHKIQLVVIDEAHTLLDSAFRERMFRSEYLMQQNLPTVFLSGTLPKACRDALSDRFCLRDPVILHSNLINEKLTYSVQEIVGSNRLQQVHDYLHSNYENVQKILCICDTRGNAEGLHSKAIDGREAYLMHRGMEDSEARMNLERFKTCKVKSILYCTAALGEGINIGGLNHLVVVGTAYSLLKLVQYSARAGRSGERGQCKVLR